MLKYKDDENVDGLLFKYHQFYGSYDYVGSAINWYRNEIRIIKNDSKIHSYKDAQGFRKGNNEKLNVKAVDAYICHYGWVKTPEMMQKKINGTAKFWGGDDVEDEKTSTSNTHHHLIIRKLMHWKNTLVNILLLCNPELTS